MEDGPPPDILKRNNEGVEMTLLLSIVCGILFVTLVFFVRAGIKASRRLQAYEEFYEDTLEDIGSVVSMLDNLMKRQLISDDPDVQTFARVVGITHDTLLRYRSAGEQAKKEN